MNLSTPENLQKTLREKLTVMGKISHCVLLDCADNFNVGDHLIGMGTFLYLTRIHQAKINYTSTWWQFSPQQMKKKLGDSTILLQGGGTFGDLWYHHQEFREKIIQTYPDHPIVILPQTLYFKEVEQLKKAAHIFNQHRQLTIFLRDQYSYEIALQYFDQCRVFLAPDNALELANLTPYPSPDQTSQILYFCRDDCELNETLIFPEKSLNNLVKDDWFCYHWACLDRAQDLPSWLVKFPRLIKLYREIWHRKLAHPLQWIEREIAMNLHPDTYTICQGDQPQQNWWSWRLIRDAIYQFQSYPFIITNRLHGHILCVILEIPHIFLPNSYHKNQQFYQTWTHQLPFCRFTDDPQKIPALAQELFYNSAQ